MPTLPNPKHEQFAQQLVHGQKFGWTRGACYSRAGYKAEGQAAEVNASRLLKNAKNGITARVQEIVGAGAKRAAVTVESLLGELDQVLAGAIDDRQYGAARAAIDSKARLKGLFIDRLEVGAPNDFAKCESDDDVVRAFLADQTPAEALATLDMLREAIERYAAQHAQIIEAAPDHLSRPSNEAEHGLQLFRPTPKSRR